MTRAEEFVRRQGWEYRKVESHNGPQLLIKVCPICFDGDGTHFYLADTYNGPFICHKCDSSGSLDDLMEQIREINPTTNPFKEHEITGTPKQATRIYLQAHYDLLRNPKFRRELEWLIKERRISVSALKQMKIGARENYGKNWITFPYWIDEEIHCCKERTIEKDFVFYYFTDNRGGPLYNSGIIKASPQYVIITEGELDTLALMSLGLRNVMSVSNGSSYINSQWLPILNDIKKIYIGYDGDSKGCQGAKNFSKQFGTERCFRLPFGTQDSDKDANAYLIHSGIDYKNIESIQDVRSDFIEKFIKPAKPLDIEGVMNIRDAIRILLDHKEMLDKSEIDTPWESINNLLDRGGFSGGDLIVVTANPGIGKTTWALNIAHHLSKKEIPNLFYELEFSPQRLSKKLICLDQEITMVTAEALLKAYSEFGKLPMYLGFRTGSLEINKAIETIRAAYNRYTLQFIVFDHLHFLVRSLSNEPQELSLAVRTFKDLAVELDTPIVLIAHLSKLPREKSSSRFREPDAEDLRGTKMLWGDADYVFLLHREPARNADARTLLTNKFLQLKRKNPGLLSPQDLIDFAKSGTLNTLKGVPAGKATEQMLLEAADRVTNIEEELEDFYSPDTKVILQKNRFGPGGVRTLIYDGAMAKFEERRKDA